MITLPKIYFELDLLGTRASNRVSYERAVLPIGVVRLIIPKYGAYYAESLQVWTVSESNARTLLTRNIDYACVEMLPKMTGSIGKEIYFVVLVTNAALGNTFDYSYNALGGEDAVNAEAVIEALDLIDLDSRPVEWVNVLGKPLEFMPGPHLHDALDLYQMEYISNALIRVKDAVVVGDHALHVALVKAVDKVIIHFQNVTFNQYLDDVHTSVVATNKTLLAINKRLVPVKDNALLAKEISDKVEVNNRKFKLNNWNASFAQILQYTCKKQFIKNGVINSIPDKIDGLQLWIETKDYSTITSTSTSLVLRDKSSHGRVYTADAASKPTCDYSSSGVSGKVLKFTNGKYLTLTTGAELRLGSAATIFCVTSGLDGNHKLHVLTDNANAGLSVKLNEGKAFVLGDSANNFNYVVTAVPLKHVGASLSVVCTEDTNNNESYAYTSYPAALEIFPSGFNTSDSNFNSINYNFTKIGCSNSTVSQGAELATLIVYDRQLSKYEVDAVLEYLNRTYLLSVNMFSNGDFEYGLDNFSTQYTTQYDDLFSESNRGSLTVTSTPFCKVFPNNTVANPSGYDVSTIAPHIGRYLAVNSSTEANKAFWSESLKLDIGVTYELKFNLVYGSINLPVIKVLINGVMHTKNIVLDPTKAVYKDIRIGFKATDEMTKIELINTNITSTDSGNTFGIDNICLVRKIYSLSN